MRKDIYIAPSLLACQKGHEEEQLTLLEKCGADFLHFDVMDGKFVSNISFNEDDFIFVRNMTDMIKDVHIMVEDVFYYIEQYASLGADIITFHYEALRNDEQRLKALYTIRSHNIKAGISIKPNTSPEVLLPLLEFVDLILVMSVEPGAGGQKFIPESVQKLNYLRNIIDDSGYDILLEVDGGINEETGHIALNAGANVLVAGSYLLHQSDTKERIANLKK